jgi:hypothetical protein
MNSRRKFIGTVASGLASTLLGANERIRIGLIGAGARGADLARQALSFPDVQIAAVADVYTRRLEESRTLLPEALHLDYRALLDDKTIDAVIIATPQHLHSEPVIDALSAGKHVYVEKTMAFTVNRLSAWLRRKRRLGAWFKWAISRAHRGMFSMRAGFWKMARSGALRRSTCTISGTHRMAARNGRGRFIRKWAWTPSPGTFSTPSVILTPTGTSTGVIFGTIPAAACMRI